MQLLEVINDSYFSTTQVVEGQSYDFTFEWNKRDESWWIEVGNTGEDPAIRTKFPVGQDVLRPYRYLDNVPNVVLLLVDVAKIYGRVGRDDFAYRFVPVILSLEEYNELIQEEV